MSNHSEGLFPDWMPLRDVRTKLRELAIQGTRCPCCTRYVKVYERPINGTMARSLIAMYRAWGRGWGDLPKLRKEAQLHHSNQEGQLAHFGLIEEEDVRREDGGRAGFWRVSELGERWVRGEAMVQKYARTYDGRLLQLTGEPVAITDVLGTGFDLREVMGGQLR